jgi:hypothetical protein
VSIRGSYLPVRVRCPFLDTSFDIKPEVFNLITLLDHSTVSHKGSVQLTDPFCRPRDDDETGAARIEYGLIDVPA